jgi:hypothetical protein
MIIRVITNEAQGAKNAEMDKPKKFILPPFKHEASNISSNNIEYGKWMMCRG